MTKVKICCIKTIEEANMAIRYGADAIGLVGPMPSGPGTISLNQIEHISKAMQPPTATFLLTSEITAQGIIQQHQQTQTNTIQIVDAMENEELIILRRELPDVKLVQVIHVLDAASVEEAKEKSQYVDMILLDSGNPNLSTKILGGTGKTHNWELSRQIKEAIDIPLFLAGGLKSENVQQAIAAIQPYGIDLCSGVRTDGKLDERKLKAFFEAVAELSQ